jgi:hypothetical protein
MIGARNALSTEEAAMRALTDNITMFAYVMTSVAFGPVLIWVFVWGMSLTDAAR